MALNSSLDAFFFMLCYFSSGAMGFDYQVNAMNGREVSWQPLIMLNTILLSTLNIYRSRSIKANVVFIEISNYFFALAAIITVFEDQTRDSLNDFFFSPHVGACSIFIFLYALLKQFIRLVIEIVLPSNRKAAMRYKVIEDKIFMEEYENPEQQFSITSLDSYAEVAKSLETNSVFSINQNLLIVHRTDSMDHILERLNFSSSRITEDHMNKDFKNNASAFINLASMKLHDINKEIEYN